MNDPLTAFASFCPFLPQEAILDSECVVYPPSHSHQEKFQQFELITILSFISNNVLTRYSDALINQVTLDFPL